MHNVLSVARCVREAHGSYGLARGVLMCRDPMVLFDAIAVGDDEYGEDDGSIRTALLSVASRPGALDSVQCPKPLLPLGNEARARARSRVVHACTHARARARYTGGHANEGVRQGGEGMARQGSAG
eukprot:6188931-Pleurochrysis_carterae.AAC.2